ncbi:FAD:protein FMN transferase [Amycolatopsis acidiphila]|uniref:FAD:protein FMN transferase n=1 Tax=Amycolatopsis acidiphila TaxID=715473 RepID=A0A558AP18_9PSEU|nr:FAD:protein FMN transferase [Amycolatopsis acidiphila]TVT25989.1 FAD:protein FMN transferase [Amycolatopsis acidiphila]UIJ63296.1 FAD:protein FMN transferase [Amycolatopsis acidiphila]GHG74860.1 FAD:protein FMN transferase [Amycolatopsis acidiphila]
MRLVRQIMGLPISLDLPRGEVDAAEQAFAWLHEVDRRFSPFRDHSEVARFDPAGPHSAEMGEILELCRTYERLTGGAFRARLPGRGFDPSGVVKGWAAQRAADLLRAAGVAEFCLNAGGDVIATGRTWSVGIRHPDQPMAVCAVLAVRDLAVATSGSYERGEHIIDGRTGLPARELVSLTVVTADLTTADAVSTAAFALGRDGIAWAAAQPGCLVHAIDAGRRVHRSPALADLLVPPGTMAS